MFRYIYIIYIYDKRLPEDDVYVLHIYILYMRMYRLFQEE
jgi:hypothetical protein